MHEANDVIQVLVGVVCCVGPCWHSIGARTRCVGHNAWCLLTYWHLHLVLCLILARRMMKWMASLLVWCATALELVVAARFVGWAGLAQFDRLLLPMMASHLLCDFRLLLLDSDLLTAAVAVGVPVCVLGFVHSK